MRGEETQLIGCISELKNEVDRQIFILPGTHSKHITVKNRQVTSFKTYMTGELFSLLSKNSVLSTAIEKAITSDFKSFKEGVKHSTKSNLLHSIFRVRTNHLFEIHTKKENFNYLSGLLIGTELLDLLKTTAKIYHYCPTKIKRVN